MLTAGHCADFATRIFVGSDVTQPGKVVKVKRRVRHPQYHHGKHNDLMVLILDQKVEDVRAAPVCAQGEDRRGHRWPRDGIRQHRCQRIVRLRTEALRRRADRVAGLPRPVDGEDDNVTYGCDVGLELVAGRPLLARDSCTGDSGGPFYVQAGDQWLLAAATSRATDSSMNNCGDGGVYVRVDRYRGWIDAIPGVTLPASI